MTTADGANPGARADLVEQWRTDGWCVIPDLFTDAEVEAARTVVTELFPSAADVESGRADETQVSWGAPKPIFPFASGALNRLVLHDAVLDLAETLLGTDRIRLYQGHVSAKYPGLREEYEQLLHADYANHTLVVPRDDIGFQHLELFIYLSDVGSDTAATRVVSRRLTGDIPVERTYLGVEEYAALYDAEVPATGPAGSVLAYRPDTFHRGTAMTTGGSVRFILHAAFRPEGAEWIGYHTWPIAGEGAEWHRFMARASVRQLTALGFPEPGHSYWTEETLSGVGARYPSLDMAPWTPAGDES